MHTTTSNAYPDKPTEGRWALGHGSRRLDRDEVDKIARRRVRIELEAQQKKMADTKTLTPAMVGTGILAGVAFNFSVMTLLNESAQDKVDKATGPLSARISEMDKRVTDRFDAVDKRMERLDGRVDKVEERLSRIESRLDRVDARFDAVHARFDAVDARFDAVDKHFESIDAKLNLLLKRR
ncbi:hypothetical protein [Cupriavidus sp. DF5525]|uniref:hypothetical protein n=1 Tax=Cupriavidus sp. DF5525 TaxID=3160989 RepID=UPI00041F9C53